MKPYSRKHKNVLSFKTFKEMIINSKVDFYAFRICKTSIGKLN